MRVGMDSVAALAQRMGITTPMRPGAGERDRRVGGASDRARRRVHGVRQQRRRSCSRASSRASTIADGSRGVRASGVDAAAGARSARRVHRARHDARRRGARQRNAGAQARFPTTFRSPARRARRTTTVDVWFVGMTPDIVAGVWLGFDKPKTIAKGAVGGGLAAPIWGQMIGRYYAGRSTSGWGPPPDGLVYAELDRTTAQARDAGDAARHALRRVLHAGHRARRSCGTIRGKFRSGARSSCRRRA